MSGPATPEVDRVLLSADRFCDKASAKLGGGLQWRDANERRAAIELSGGMQMKGGTRGGPCNRGGRQMRDGLLANLQMRRWL